MHTIYNTFALDLHLLDVLHRVLEKYIALRALMQVNMTSQTNHTLP